MCIKRCKTSEEIEVMYLFLGTVWKDNQRFFQILKNQEENKKNKTLGTELILRCKTSEQVKAMREVIKKAKNDNKKLEKKLKNQKSR